MPPTHEENFAAMTAGIVSAYVNANRLPPEALPELIANVHDALVTAQNGGAAEKPEPLKPAVPVKKSVTPGYIICLEDGKKFKSLKRHLQSHYNLTPDQYREKWGLSRDYPMVAPDYAAQRSELARDMGLGRRTVPPVAKGRSGR